MRAVSLAWLVLAGALVVPMASGAGPSPSWTLPRDHEVCLMENDLVYARFLTLARDGAYRQINRDEYHSVEVDRGTWEQEASGNVRLHSTCRAMRPRGLSSGSLSITLAGDEAFAGLPLLLESLRRFLAAEGDPVFGAETMSELNRPGAPAVHLGGGAMTFDRRDATALAARIEAALTSERTATYVLEPVKNHAAHALFILQGSAFGPADLAEVRRTYRVADGKTPPFYFSRVEAKTYAAEVGRWQPLSLPGGAE